MGSIDDATGKDEIKNALRIDSEAVRSHLDELVRSTVEDTLNRLLDAEA